MPTVIILDTSLSMCRPVLTSHPSESLKVKDLAIHGLSRLLDYMTNNCKLEYAALMTFSSCPDALVPFTRDFESIKVASASAEFYKNARILEVLDAVQHLILKKWGASVSCQLSHLHLPL